MIKRIHPETIIGKNGDYLFSYFIFDKIEDTDFQKYFEWYILALRDKFPPLAYPADISRNTDIDYADYQFDSHSVRLISEIKERMEILRQKGINEIVLKAVQCRASNHKLSAVSMKRCKQLSWHRKNILNIAIWFHWYFSIAVVQELCMTVQR